MASAGDAFWLVAVAAIWGGTNPLLKQTGRGIENVEKKGRFSQIFAEFLFLISNWKYMLSFIANQVGSVVFYLTLASADISLAVPITNSLTFVFTTIAGRLMGERIQNKEMYIGMILVTIGVVMCIIAKHEEDT